MAYGFGCSVVDRPNHLMTSAEMSFIWLPLSIMNCNGDPFTHICGWKRQSPSFRCYVYVLWILVVEIVKLGFVLIIFFPFSFPLPSSYLDSEHAFEFESFSSITSDCLAQHSFVL